MRDRNPIVMEIKSPSTVYTIWEQRCFKIFLAGGISGCEYWQGELVDIITDCNQPNRGISVPRPEHPAVALYNPVRFDYDMSDETMEEEQITWEYVHIERADIVSFWFSHETIQPITLFELGKVLGSGKRVIIGIHPEYSRRSDVLYQAKLAGYTGNFPSNLKRLGDEIKGIIWGGEDVY